MERSKKFYWNITVPAVQLVIQEGKGTDISINPDLKTESPPELNEIMKFNGYEAAMIVKNPHPRKEFPKDAKYIDPESGQIRCDQDLLICYGKHKPLIIETIDINF